MAIAAGFLALALWLFARGTLVTKVAVVFVYVVFGVILVTFAGFAAAATVARVTDGRLNFFFCGLRTRSIPLDGATTFELQTIGRLRVLCIRSGRSSYVPNGALDVPELVDLLWANGVVERKDT